MTASGLKEIISFVGIALLILSIILIQLSRIKLKGWFAGIVSVIAYFCLLFGALAVVYIVFSGPTG